MWQIKLEPWTWPINTEKLPEFLDFNGCMYRFSYLLLASQSCTKVVRYNNATQIWCSFVCVCIHVCFRTETCLWWMPKRWVIVQVINILSVSPCFLEESVSLTLTLATAVPLFTPHWNNASPPMLFPKSILKRQAVKSTLYAMFGEGLNVKLETLPPMGDQNPPGCGGWWWESFSLVGGLNLWMINHFWQALCQKDEVMHRLKACRGNDVTVCSLSLGFLSYTP